MPACLNAANEELAAGFLGEKLRFLEIPRHIETVMGRHHGRPARSLEDVLETDSWARAATQELMAA